MEGTLNTTITLKEEILKSRKEIAATEGLKAISMRSVAVNFNIALVTIYIFQCLLNPFSIIFR